MEEKQLTLADVLTNEEKEIIGEYRETMNMTWSKIKSYCYYEMIMEILDEAEERYYMNRNLKKQG